MPEVIGRRSDCTRNEETGLSCWMFFVQQTCHGCKLAKRTLERLHQPSLMFQPFDQRTGEEAQLPNSTGNTVVPTTPCRTPTLRPNRHLAKPHPQTANHVLSSAVFHLV
jgi:hypothetical protein